MDTEKTVVGADNYYAYPSFEYSLPSYPIGCLAPSKASICSNNRGYGYFALPENEIFLSFSLAFSPALAFNNYLHVLNDLVLNEYLDIYSPSLLINRSVLPPIQKVVVGADNYYYAFPTWAAEIPPLNVNLLISCSDHLSFTSENLLSQIFEIGDVYSFINEEDILDTLSLFDSYIQDANLFCDFLLSSTLNLHSFLFHTYGETISDVIKPTVRSENYYAFPSWLPAEHLHLNFTLNCGESYELINEGLISKIFRLDDTYSRLYESLLSFSLFSNELYSTESRLLNVESLLSSPHVYTFLFHKYEKGIIDAIKPTV